MSIGVGPCDSKGGEKGCNYGSGVVENGYVAANGQANGGYPGYLGRSSTTVATVGNSNVRITVQTGARDKSVVEAYILCLVLGLIGGHHFYLGRIGFGFLYVFTFGLFGFGVLGDLVRIPMLVKEVNYKLKNPEFANDKTMADAYILWFPFGLLGFHHFYLKNFGLGILYLFTFGLFGIGWLVDAFRIPSLVRETNAVAHGDTNAEKTVCTAYICALSPFGVIGLHHYYLQRPVWGVLYTLTFGLLGVGWICDWFRIPFLVERCNQANQLVNGVRKVERKYLDDAYILLCPWGIAGLHHFYLRRYCWGTIYLCTFGLMGIGWIVDMFRLPGLVKEYNQTQEERQRIITTVAHEMGGQAASVTVSSTNASVPTHVVGYPGMIVIPTHLQQGMQCYTQQQIYPSLQNWQSGGKAIGPTSPAGYHQQIGEHGDFRYDDSQMQPPKYDDITKQNEVTSDESADKKPIITTEKY